MPQVSADPTKPFLDIHQAEDATDPRADVWAEEALDDPAVLKACTHWHQTEDGALEAETVLEIAGIECASCAGLIETAVIGIQGVRAVQVSAAARRAVVVWWPAQTRLSTVVAAVRGAGYDAAPALHQRAEEGRAQERRALLWRLFVACFCAMQVMMLATPSYVAAAAEITPDLQRLLNWGQWLLTLPVMIFSAAPFLSRAVRAAMRRRLVMDVPVALGILVMFGASSIATFVPLGPLGAEVVFDSLTMFVSFLLLARWLEMRVRHAAARELETLLRQTPRPVMRLDETGMGQNVMPSSLQPGDRIRVPVGEAFAVDGVLLSGRTTVSESILTGESAPVVREPGQQVMAGSLNLGVPVELCVTGVGSDTRREQLVRLAERASLERPATLQAADRWAGPFLILVMSLALIGSLAWLWIEPTRALWVGVAVLVVTCPCALSLAAPAALVAAARGLVREGLLLQRLGALEDLARVDTMVFDKTGTLTVDRLELVEVRCTTEGSCSAERLRHAASLAAWSRHPASQAVVRAARGVGFEAAARPDAGPFSVWLEVREFPGQGIEGRDPQGRVWRLGRSFWVLGGSGQPPNEEPDATHLAWGPKGRIEAHFVIADGIRQEARPALNALRSMGLDLAVLSGDTPSRVRERAEELGLDVIGSERLPDEKRRVLRGLQERGRFVAMVGDGVNDAPGLAQAQVSLAMGHGAAMTVARADLVVLAHGLMALPAAVRRARLAQRLIRQNLSWALLYNLGAIPMALMGWLPPWAAGLGMALSSLLVVLNGQRAGR